MWLNLVMKACLSQSTAISETRTIKTGEKIWLMVVSEGRTEMVMYDAGNEEKVDPETSMRLRRAMMDKRADSWKRSTMSDFVVSVKPRGVRGRKANQRNSSEIGSLSQTF